MHKPRSPSRKKHLLKEFQFPGGHHRASNTSSPLSLTAKADLDSSLKGHFAQLGVKISSETTTPTSSTPSKPLQFRPQDPLHSAKLRDVQAELEQMAVDYQHALEENESLRQQTLIYTSLRTTGSASTVFAPTSTRDDEETKQSLADEFEALTELLSDAHMSMALLLNERDDLRERTKQTKTELNTLKFQNQMGGRPRDRKVEELSAELTRQNEELKGTLKDKQRAETRMQEASRRGQELEVETRALRDKISILSRRNPDEFGSASEIYKKLAVVRGLISQQEERNRKLETHAEKKVRKKR